VTFRAVALWDTVGALDIDDLELAPVIARHVVLDLEVAA
jgi:hypothetical protein